MLCLNGTYQQLLDDMMKVVFLYEKKNNLDETQKKTWLKKFATRLNNAIYKWYISAPGPIVDVQSINKAEFKQLITSNIDY